MPYDCTLPRHCLFVRCWWNTHYCITLLPLRFTVVYCLVYAVITLRATLPEPDHGYVVHTGGNCRCRAQPLTGRPIQLLPRLRNRWLPRPCIPTLQVITVVPMNYVAALYLTLHTACIDCVIVTTCSTHIPTLFVLPNVCWHALAFPVMNLTNDRTNLAFASICSSPRLYLDCRGCSFVTICYYVTCCWLEWVIA